MPHNAGVSGQYPPPPPNQPPHQPPNQPPSQQPTQLPGQQPGQPGWGAAPPTPPYGTPTPGYPQTPHTPQYPSYGGGPTGPGGPGGPGAPGGYQGYPPPGGGSGGGGKGLLITTIVVGAVAVIAAITTMIIVLTGDDDEPSAGGGDESSQTDEPTSETDEPTTESEPEPEPEPEPTSDAPEPPPDGAVPVGTESAVGDWAVTVTTFDDNADEEIKQANQFNEPPSGRYVLATIEATYNGAGEGNLSFGLHMTFKGPGGDEHEDYDCGAVEPNSSISAPPLKKGDSYTFDTCFDVPIASIEGATMAVNQDFDDATEVVFDL